VDLSLVAEFPEGIEFHRDTVRISSIPVDPGNGRIIFVNPESSSPTAPYNNFVKNAAHDVYNAIAAMQAGDNIVIARGPYTENGIPLTQSGVIAGLAGSWIITNPSQTASPLADDFDFSALPVLDGGGPPRGLLASASIFSSGGVSGNGQLSCGGLLLRNGSYNELAEKKSGAASYLSALSSPVRISFCRFLSNTAFDFGGAIYCSTLSDVKIKCVLV
jgi:predicted outer membrane repeat protein